MIAHKRPHGACHSVARTHADHFLDHAQRHRAARIEHILHAAHGPPEEEIIREPVEAFGQSHKPGIALAGAGAGGIGIERFAHLGHIRDQIERGAIGEETAPLRIERHQIDRVGQIPAGFGEDAFEHRRNREDCRAHVEAEALLRQDGCLAPHPGVGIAERDGIAARRQRAGCGQATQTATDDHHPVLITNHVHLPSSAA